MVSRAVCQDTLRLCIRLGSGNVYLWGTLSALGEFDGGKDIRLMTAADKVPMCKHHLGRRELACRSPWPWRRLLGVGSGDSTALRVRLARKERRNRQRILRIKEYNRLRAMVPSIASKPKVSKVTVIEEAVRYIDQLHSALIERLQARGLPPCLQSLPLDMTCLNQTDIRQLVRVLVENRNAAKRSSAQSATSTNSQTSSASTPASSTSGPNSQGSSTSSWRMSLSECEKSRTVPSYMLRLDCQKKTT